MKKIIEYIVLKEHDLNKLIQEVNDLIRKGWQPFGELHTVPTQSFPDTPTIFFFQSMVLYGD